MAGVAIEAVNLSKLYRAAAMTVPALNGVSLTVAKGEFAAIVGPSGSGKSTLMSLLGLLDQPTEGSYRLGGQETRGLDDDARARLRSRSIGFVFQNYNLLARNTALENVALPLVYSGYPRRKRRDRAAELLASVGLAHRLDHWPNQLSGGEQQRVAIARAFVNDPDLVLADEPTGALDTRTGEEILALLRCLNRDGRTILLVTHEPRIAGLSDRVISMRDGRVVRDQQAPSPAVPLRLAASRCAATN